MSKRDIWKIRLRPDGTWENIYKDEFYEMDGKTLAGMFGKERSIVDRFALEEIHRLETMRENFIESALEQVGCTQANEIIDRIRYDRTRD